MREVAIDRLKPVNSLPVIILHKSGTILLQKGEALTSETINTLKRNNVDFIYIIEPGDNLDKIQKSFSQKSIAITSLTPGENLKSAVYDEGGHLLIDAGAKIPDKFTESLKNRGIETIYSTRTNYDHELKKAKDLRTKLKSLLPKAKPAVFSPVTTNAIKQIQLQSAEKQDFNQQNLNNKINRQPSMEVGKEGRALSRKVRDTRKMPNVSQEEKKLYSTTIKTCLQKISSILQLLSDDTGNVSIELIDDVITTVLSGMIHNRDLLTICGTEGIQNEDYLVSHSLAVTVLSSNIGISMGYGAAQVKALAYGAMLADVGISQIPSAIINKKDKLTPNEYAMVKRHPGMGLDILQNIRGLPKDVPYIVYQSHERANGSGYPCGKKDSVIHTFANIVGTADTFIALCSDRPYRKKQSLYQAMEAIVFMAGKRELNSKTVRALLSCYSLFPVGSFVQLSNQTYGRVVAGNPEDFMRPVVSVIWDKNLKKLSCHKRINLLSVTEISVTKAINNADLPADKDIMIGF